MVLTESSRKKKLSLQLDFGVASLGSSSQTKDNGAL